MFTNIFIALEIFCLVSVQSFNSDRIEVHVKSSKVSDGFSSKNVLVDVEMVPDGAERAGLINSEKAWPADLEKAERSHTSNVDWSKGIDVSYLGNKMFGSPSETTGENLEEWSPFEGENPEEMGEYAEGDILVPNNRRNGLRAESKRWVNGTVPYTIASTFADQDVEMIERAIELYHKHTCIRFRPKVSSDTDYVTIINSETGCWSSIGRISGPQKLNLQTPQCTTKVGTTLHEMMHALGFFHEQARSRRDDYITVVWDNIKEGKERNFNKKSNETTTGFGVDYDYGSVMHYSKHAFSVNGKPTLIPKGDLDGNTRIGQRNGFSKGDITKINAMYGCNVKPSEDVKKRSGLFRSKADVRKRPSWIVSVSSYDDTV